MEARELAARSQAEAKTNAVERFASQRRCQFAISAVKGAGSRRHFSDLLSTPGAGPSDQAKARNRSGVPVGHCSATDFASGAARLTRRSVLEQDLVECAATPVVEGGGWWPRPLQLLFGLSVLERKGGSEACSGPGLVRSNSPRAIGSTQATSVQCRRGLPADPGDLAAFRAAPGDVTAVLAQPGRTGLRDESHLLLGRHRMHRQLSAWTAVIKRMPLGCHRLLPHHEARSASARLPHHPCRNPTSPVGRCPAKVPHGLPSQPQFP